MAQTRTHDQKEDKEKLKSAASGHDNESFL